MAVGRISGPLLKSNLIRNGIDLAFETDLLYLDVNNQRIGIKTATPTHELQISGTTRTTNLIVDDWAEISGIRFENNTISTELPYLNLGTLDTVVYQNRLTVDDISLNGNVISTTVSNSNLELRPNGTGSVEVHSDMNVDGNIHATGNISADGNITIGDGNTDNVVFNAEVASDIIPDTTDTYALGSNPSNGGKRWNDVWVKNLRASNVNTDDLVVDGIDLILRQGNIWYVAENGDDAHSGDHPQDPFASIKYALSVATAGDTVHIYPGVYTEVFPLTVPVGVTVKGQSIRSVTIQPTTETRYNDAILLNGESTVEDITVTGFYSGGNLYKTTAAGVGSTTVNVGITPFAHAYVSGGTINISGADYAVTGATYDHTTGVVVITHAGPNAGIGTDVFLSDLTFSCNGDTRVFPDNGYAFRFATDFEVTSRSPYIKNITVITSGAQTDPVTDPRGFDAGNAGKGAYIDGAYATANSKEAAMLFHSATFITPGVDAITATNGARIEWLNSFTYFANRSFFVYDSNAGKSYNGRTLVKLSGVTGTFTAGNTLTLTSTDSSTVITATIDEVKGNVVYLDGYIEDLIGFDTTPASISDGTATATDIDATDFREFGAEVRMIGSASVYGNFGLVGSGPGVLVYAISHNLGYIGSGKEETNELESVNQANEIVQLDGATIVFNSVDHKGDFRVGDLFYVNQQTGDVTFNSSDFVINTQNGITISDGGNTTFIDATKVDTGNLRLSGNTLSSLSGDINLDAAATNTINLNANVNVTGDLDVTGDVTIGGNITIGDEATDTVQFVAGIESNITPSRDSTYSLGTSALRWSNLYVTEVTSDDISIRDNFIETTLSNSNLELRANGTGNVSVPSNDVQIDNNLTVNGTTTLGNAVINGTITHTGNYIQTGNLDIAGEITNGNILIEDNFISTTNTNSDLELRASGTGEIAIPTNNVQIDNDLTVSGVTDLQDTTVTGTLTHVGNYNQIGDTTITGNVTVTQDLDVSGAAQFEEILIDDNFITTTTSNADLELRASGTGKVLIPNNDVQIVNDLTVDNDITSNNLTTTGLITADSFTNNDILIDDNFIETVNSNTDLELRANGTGNVSVPSNDVQIDNNLTVDGTTTLGNAVINGTITHTGNYIQTGNLDIAGEITNGNILIEDNFISTTNTNSDLELRASGTGEIAIPTNNVQIDNDLTVSGVTDLQDTTVTGTLTHVGNYNQIGDTTITGNVTVTQDLDVSGAAQFEEILIDDNFITTTTSNADLELRASGTGKVLIPNNDVQIVNDLTVDNDITSNNLTTTGLITADSFTNNDILIDDNFIETVNSNTDLELRANGTGNVSVPSNDVQIDNNLTVNGTTTLKGTSITGTLTHVGNTIQTGNFTIAGSWTNDNIEINTNYITTTNSNSDLDLRANGTGKVLIPNNDVQIDNNLTVDGVTTLGNTVINGTITHTGNVSQSGNLDVTGNFTVTQDLDVTGAAQFEEILIDDNFITTTTSNADLELRANGTGEILVPNNDVHITNDLAVDGTITVGDINSAGTITANRFSTGDILIDDNFITTTTSNSNLELRANGTGEVVVPSNNVIIEQNLTVNGTTDLKGTNIVGNVTHTGDVTQTGDINLTGNLDVDGDITIAGAVQFENIQIAGNVVETTLSNADLELRANGTGEILVPNNNVNINGNLTVDGTLTVRDIDSVGIIQANTFSTGDILVDDNFITTTVSNSDLELRAAGTGSIILDNLSISGSTISSSTDLTIIPGSGIVDIVATGALNLPAGTELQRPSTPLEGMLRFNTDVGDFEGYNGLNWNTLGGVFDDDKDTKITAELTPGADDDIIRFYVANTVVADLDADRLNTKRVSVDDIEIDGNVISTVTTDTDLELTAQGTGSVTFENFAFKENTITNKVSGSNTVFETTGTGIVEFADPSGIVLPVGSNATRPVGVTGMIRFNTNDERVELYDGTTWVSVAGASGGISFQDAENIAIEKVLIFG